MSENSSTDNIIFTIDVQPADGAGSKIDSFVRPVIEGQNRISESAKDAAQSGVEAAESAASSLKEEFITAAESAASMAADVKESATSMAQEVSKSYESWQEAFERFFKVANQPIASPEEVNAGWERLHDLVKESGAALEETSKQALDAEIALNKAAQVDDFKALDDTLGKIKEGMEQVKSAADDLKEISELNESIEELSELHEEFGETAKEAFGEAFKGSMEFVKGLAEIGLISEENSEEILKGFVAIQGTYEALKGGYEVLSAIAKGVEAFMLVKLTDGEITKKTAEIEAIRVRGLQAEAIAATEAAAANVELAGARLLAGKAAGKTGGGVAGTAASSAVEKAASAAASSGGAAAVGGASAAAGAGAAAGGGFFSSSVGGVAMGFAATAGIVIASLAGIGFGATVLGEQLTGTANKVDSFSNKIASWELSVADWIAKSFGGEGWDKSEEQNKKLDAIRSRRERGLEQDKIRGEGQREIDFARQDSAVKIARDSANNLRAPVDLNAVNAAANQAAGDRSDPDQVKTAYAAALSDAQQIAKLQQQGAVESEQYEKSVKSASEFAKQIEDLTRHSMTEGDEYANAMARGKKSSEDAAESASKLREIARDTAQIQIAAAQRSIDAIDTEISKRKESIKDTEDAAASAAERFAQLDEIGQANAIEAINRARAGQDLSKEDRAALRSVGGDEASKFARDADIKDAKSAGFDQAFGGGFEAERTKLQNEITDLEARLKVQTEVKVTLETNLDGAIQKFTGTIDELLRKQQEVFEQKIQASVDQKLKAVSDKQAEGRAYNRQ